MENTHLMSCIWKMRNSFTSSESITQSSTFDLTDGRIRQLSGFSNAKWNRKQAKKVFSFTVGVSLDAWKEVEKIYGDDTRHIALDNSFTLLVEVFIEQVKNFSFPGRCSEVIFSYRKACTYSTSPQPPINPFSWAVSNYYLAEFSIPT